MTGNASNQSIYVRWSNRVPDLALVGVSSFLSVIGASIIILTYVFIKDIRTVSRHIIVCISIADLVTCLSNLGGLLIKPSYYETPLSCKLQSFFGTSAILSSFLWTMMLAVYLYVVIVKERPSTGKKIIMPYSHLLCWTVPLIINSVALDRNMLGNGGDETSSGWCWIKTRENDATLISRHRVIAWMVLDGKGIEIITYVVIAYLYIAIKVYLRAKIKRYDSSEYGTFLTQRTANAAKQMDRKLILMPLILIMLRIWGTIRFFIYVANAEHSLSKDTKRFLVTMHAIGDNLLGFLNCVLFCFLTPKVRRHIICWCNVCCQKLSRRSDNDEENYTETDLDP